MDWLVVELIETVDIHLFDECYSRGEADSLRESQKKGKRAKAGGNAARRPHG